MENNFVAGHVIVAFKDEVPESRWTEIIKNEGCDILSCICPSMALISTPIGKEGEYIKRFRNKQEVEFAEFDCVRTTCKT